MYGQSSFKRGAPENSRSTDYGYSGPVSMTLEIKGYTEWANNFHGERDIIYNDIKNKKKKKIYELKKN